MEPRQPDAPLLRIRGLHKRYAAPVLAGVDLDLAPGEVHALVGGNGAGKSTLSRIVCGLTPPDAGHLELGGAAYRPRSRADAEAAGVQIVMQELTLIPTLSVAENVFFGRLPNRFGFVNRTALRAGAQKALAAIGLGDLDPDVPVARLGVGRQQLVELAAALVRPCRLLILDEPTAALTEPEIEILFRHVRRLSGEGVGILYISHRMEEVLRLCHRVTVLRDGRIVQTQPAARLTVNEVVQQMAGRTLEASENPGPRVPGEPALRVEKLCRGPLVRDVSFEVRRGEVLGLAGLVGSGRTETLRALFGADVPEAGRVWVAGRLVRIRRPRDAVRAGIGMIPEDRKAQGLLLPQPIRVNGTLARLQAVTRFRGWIDRRREHELARRLGERLAVVSASVEQPVDQLSGGNQQKVLIGRWLLRDADVLLFDEPTRGIDVAAKQAVYALIDELAGRGKAVVFVSSELRELTDRCDRIAVLSAGRLVATFDRGAWSEEAIMAAAFSGYVKR